MTNAIEREFLQRDRARLTTRLERTRRMQMIGSLASGIARNFNNIIGAILGYSEMVEPQLTPGTKPAQHIDEIRRAAERGRDLIDNILTFGRRRDGRVRSVQVRTLFEEAASLLRASLPPASSSSSRTSRLMSPCPASWRSCSRSSSIYAPTRRKRWNAADISA